MHHTIAASGSSLHGFFDNALPPVLTIGPGDTVRFETLDAWWSAGPYAGGAPADRARVPEWRAEYGHALTGPVAIEGARPGRTLAVRIDAVTPGSYGATVAGGRATVVNDRSGILDEWAVLAWDLDTDVMLGRDNLGHTVALHPFMGVMGVAPAEPGAHSTIPPRRTGGNLDCKELVAGSTLYLPIAVDGALFSVGDGHAAQGDGEVGGTAIECPMTVELSFDVVDLPIATPMARTASGWLTMGVADTLDDAGYLALNAMYDLMTERFGLRRAEAVALASVVVDTRVTQIVNQVVGVHAILRDDAVS